jgi:hypothetical protein
MAITTKPIRWIKVETKLLRTVILFVVPIVTINMKRRIAQQGQGNGIEFTLAGAEAEAEEVEETVGEEEEDQAALVETGKAGTDLVEAWAEAAGVEI